MGLQCLLVASVSHCSLDPDLQDGGCLEPSRRGPRKPALWVRRTSQSWLPGGGCTSSVTLLSSPGRRSGRACCPEEAEMPKLCPGHGNVGSRAPLVPHDLPRGCLFGAPSPRTDPAAPPCHSHPQQCVLGHHSPQPCSGAQPRGLGAPSSGALVTLSRARRAAWRYQRQKEPRPRSGPRSASGPPCSQRLMVEWEAGPHRRASEWGIRCLREKPDPGVTEGQRDRLCTEPWKLSRNNSQKKKCNKLKVNFTSNVCLCVYECVSVLGLSHVRLSVTS